MDKPVVLMDLDSVVVDLLQPWLDMYNMEYDDNLTEAQIDDWDTHKFVKPECGMCIYKYLNTPNFFADLDPIEGAVAGLEELASLAEVVIVTSALALPQATVDKLAWVQRYLPFIPKKNIIVTARKDLIHGDIMVDDSPANLAETPARHKVVFDYAYNRHVLDAERVHNWPELVEAVKRYISG